MAPCNGTTSTPPTLAVTPPGTKHTTMAPCYGTTSKVGRHPPPATIAHYNGTLQWHPAMAPRPLPQSWSSPSPPTIAHYNGTVRWHSNGTTSSAPCSGTLVPGPIRQSGSSPSSPIGSKNPYSYRYLGNKTHSIFRVFRVEENNTAGCFLVGSG